MAVRELICLKDYINFIKTTQVENYISDFNALGIKDGLKFHTILNYKNPNNRQLVKHHITKELELIGASDANIKIDDQLSDFVDEQYIKGESGEHFLLMEELLHASYIHRNILIKYISRFTDDVDTAVCIVQEVNDYYHRWETWMLGRMHNIHQEIVSYKTKEVKRFFDLINNLPQKAWVIDPHNGKVMYNRQWSLYTGLPQEDNLNIPAGVSAIHPDESEELQKVIGNAMAKNHLFEFYCRLRGVNNIYRWHLLRGVPIVEEDGQIHVWTGTYTDIHDEYLKNITLIKDSEVKIENLYEKIKDLTYLTKDQSNFIYMASHDLKAPLSNIQGLVQVLKETIHETGPEVSEVFKMIDVALLRFKDTLHEISQVVHRTGTLEDINFEDVIEEIEENLNAQIKQADASIRFDFNSAPVVKALRKNIYTILVNLVSNSIKYRSPDRKLRVTIRSERRDSVLILTYKDNASGMDLNKTDIFKKGERQHLNVEGTGIGLYLVKNIVESFGGKISVQSEIGKGSIFKIFLPFH